MKTNNDRENRKKYCEGQIERTYLVEKLQSTRGNIQSNKPLHIQVSMEEATKKTQEEYLKLHFIPYL